MSAEELYRLLKKSYPDVVSTICRLHKPCSGISCIYGNTQSSEVLDFDEIERLYHTGNASSASSVDCVTVDKNNTIFCFVEIKGWRMFLSNPGKIQNVTEKDIAAQTARYKLKEKLDSSMRLCTEISKDSRCFENMTVVYILVTDIEVSKSPLLSLSHNLTALSLTSTRWNDICNRYMLQKMDSIKDIKKRYICCKDFDAELEHSVAADPQP